MYPQLQPRAPRSVVPGLRTVSADDPALPQTGGRVTALPVYRNILAVDIENSTGRTNPARRALRSELYQLLLESLRGVGIEDGDRERFVDRGDGALVLIHPVDHVPKPLLLTHVVPCMSKLVRGYNDALPAGELAARGLRIRTVLHAGEVHYDGYGPFGESVDVACRLLDARRVKKCLRGSSAPLVLVVSDHLHSEIIRHRYAGIDPSVFAPLVTVSLGGRRHRGWVCVSDVELLPVERALAVPAPRRAIS